MVRPESLRFLQFGASGQLARELVRAATDEEGAVLSVVARAAADFSRPDEIVRAMTAADDIDVVINATGYTSVDKAESEEVLANRINAESVGILAEACAKRGIPLIHVSTDYVFDGAKLDSYVETDPACPLNAYGRTKLAGERQVREATDRHVIVRTSWVFSAHGANFVKTMLRLGSERDEVRVVDDQYGSPTSAADLADAIVRIARAIRGKVADEHYGTFHYSGAGTTTWCRFAKAILARAVDWADTRARIIPIETAEYPTPARRAHNSTLNCDKIARVYGIEAVPWTIALDRVLQQLKAERIRSVP
jgi:dTDP-4-dehydrorhamnose reductase